MHAAWSFLVNLTLGGVLIMVQANLNKRTHPLNTCMLACNTICLPRDWCEHCILFFRCAMLKPKGYACSHVSWIRILVCPFLPCLNVHALSLSLKSQPFIRSSLPRRAARNSPWAARHVGRMDPALRLLALTERSSPWCPPGPNSKTKSYFSAKYNALETNQHIHGSQRMHLEDNFLVNIRYFFLNSKKTVICLKKLVTQANSLCATGPQNSAMRRVQEKVSSFLKR
jgi:hypothetical protein